MAAVEAFDPVAYINEPRWRDSSYGLHRIRALLERLGRPQDRLRFVHVAGTNGKGSTCAFIATMLREAGYRTGMFTSPFLFHFEERIQVDGACISWDDLTRVTLEVRDAAEALADETGDHPTEFELMTAVALVHFAQSACDIVVLEVGLGGTLDSTNVIDALEVAVITRIGLDHTALLGDTLAEIARQKAGIIKQGSVVVKQADVPEVMEVISEVAAELGCDMVVAEAEPLEAGGPRIGRGAIAEDGGRRSVQVSAQSSTCVETNTECSAFVEPCAETDTRLSAGHRMRCFRYGDEVYETRLLGSYQAQNAATALAAIDALRLRGWDISAEAARRGIANTRWPARFELVATDPDVIVDGGHNPQGALALVDTLLDVYPGQKVVFLMSVLADKDYRAMVRTVLPYASAFVTFTSPSPRALDAQELAATIQDECCSLCSNTHDGDSITQCGAVPSRAVGRDVAKGMHLARVLAGAHGVVVAFGSLYSVSEVMDALAKDMGKV